MAGYCWGLDGDYVACRGQLLHGVLAQPLVCWQSVSAGRAHACAPGHLPVAARACVPLPCALLPCVLPGADHLTVCCALLMLLLLHPAAAETQDAEQAQACLLVTLVVLAKGTVKLPAEPLRDQQAFKESMKSVSAGQCWSLGFGSGTANAHAVCSLG